MNSKSKLAAIAALCCAPLSWAAPVFSVFEAAAATPAGIAATRDAFRTAIGGGTVAGAHGSFGGLRREINWDAVPDARSDPDLLAADFFNTNSPRGAVFSTPGTGFLVSANSGRATPPLFGFANDFQAFSAQRLFTAINSPITEVSFFVPGTSQVATTGAFGVIFTDIEVAGLTRLDFFDASDALIFSRDALAGGNQSLTFLGATVTGGAIGRVRIVSGLNAITGNGALANPNDDVVVMDDFIYAEPLRSVPEPGSLTLAGLALLGGLTAWRRGSRSLPVAQPF